MAEPLQDRRPSGFTRAVLRAPVWLYRCHLGRLLGGRFVLLEHRGRRTGQTRRNVLEVLDHDARYRRVIVVSGWGERSDWFRNVMADPNVTFETHGTRRRATAQRLDASAAETALRHYGDRHPRAFRTLAKRMTGEEPLAGVHAAANDLATKLPVVALTA